jgi:excisionase family DNA binding protein
MHPTEPLPDLFSVNQVATFCGVKPRTVRRWINTGQLPARKLGPRSTRVTRADLELLIHRKLDES